MTARRLARALRGLVTSYLDAYAETAWVYRYGPGFAPTAPVRFADGGALAAERPAYRAGAARAPRAATFGGRPLGGAGRRQTPASRSAAHASASA